MWAGSVVLGSRWAGRLVWLPPAAAPRQAVPPGEEVPTYTTRAGDLLDWVCWRFYGTAPGAVTAVLAANPGLAAWGTDLPHGLVLRLPSLPTAATLTHLPRLWN